MEDNVVIDNENMEIDLIHEANSFAIRLSILNKKDNKVIYIKLSMEEAKMLGYALVRKVGRF